MISGISMLFLFLGSLVLCDRMTPVARQLALRRRIVDQPSGRKRHEVPVPLLGGVAIVAATLLAGAAFLLISRSGHASGRLLIAACGAILMHLVGTWDDARVMRARRKLLLQILISTGVIAGGLRIASIDFPSLRLPLGLASAPLTVVWIVAVTNAWNLVDGLDGLAAGTAAIAATVLALLFAGSGSVHAVVVLLALAGACVGFLRYNFHPATVFMGDGGSLFIGYVLAVAPLLAADSTAGAAALDARIPLLIYLLPVADITAAVIRRGRIALRIRRRWGVPVGRSLLTIGVPDRRHLHHLLLRHVHAQPRVAAAIFGLAATSGGLALLIGFSPFGWPVLLGGPFGIGLLLYRLGCLRPASRATAKVSFPARQQPSRGRRRLSQRAPHEERQAA